MKIELKKLIHARSLSQETNAFTADLYVNGEKVATCKNSGTGGMTDIYPEYTTDEKKRKYYRNVITKAEIFCKGLPPHEYMYKNEKKQIKMDLEFFVNLEVEKDLKKKDIDKVIKKLDKDALNNIITISKKKLEDVKAGKSNELPYQMFCWKKPLADLPVGLIKMQLPAIQAKLKGDEFIYNKNIPQ